MRLHAAPFALISSGAKTIELRLYDKKRAALDVGSYLSFQNREDGNCLFTQVKALHRAENFESLIDTVGLPRLGVSCKESLLMELDQYYPPMMQQRSGVLGIEFYACDFISRRELLKESAACTQKNQSVLAELKKAEALGLVDCLARREEAIPALEAVLAKLNDLLGRCEVFSAEERYIEQLYLAQEGLVMDVIAYTEDLRTQLYEKYTEDM